MSTSRQRPDGGATSLRVLMVVPQFPYPVVGGLEKQARLLSEELMRLGCEVCVLSGRMRPSQPAFTHEEGIEVYRLPWPRHRAIRWVLSPWSFAAAFLPLARRCDVVHCHVLSGVGSYAILLARLLRKPILVKLANVGASGLPGLRKRTLGALRLNLFGRADAVVAMSGESLAELETVGYPVARTLVTPNGIRVPERAHAWPTRVDSACRLLMVGRLVPQKGIQDLLQALRQLSEGTVQVQPTLDIAGEGSERANIEAAIYRHALGRRVRLLGHVERVPELMAGYDALVLPSYREGNSNVILEAMAAGLPVISTTVGGTRMLVGPGGARLLHAPGDVAALACLIEEVITNPEMRCRLGDAMRVRAEELFDVRIVARRYLAAYHLLAHGQRNRIGELACGAISADAAAQGKDEPACVG